MNSEQLNTDQKALSINLDKMKYGTCAEIGAGQEVARLFFRVGGASQKTTKSMSAWWEFMWEWKRATHRVALSR